MKKTLVALSVMAAATSAQAIELYNQDGVTVNMAGDIEVVYLSEKSDSWADDAETVVQKDTDFHQEIQDADFGFDVRYQVSDSLQFGGYWEFSGDKGKADTGDMYIGFYHDTAGSLKIGKTCGMVDDAGIGNDFQFGIESFVDNEIDACGDEAVRYEYDNGMFYAGLGLIEDYDNSKKIGNKGSYYDAKVGVRVADFDFTAIYGDADLKKADLIEDTLLALEARYAGVENLNLAVAYYNMESKNNTAVTKAESDTIALAADYTFSGVTVGAGYSTTDFDEAGSKDFDSWYVNAAYGFAPNTTAYVEVGGDNGKQTTDDTKSTDTGVAIGVKAFF
jgi:predicted porin